MQNTAWVEAGLGTQTAESGRMEKQNTSRLTVYSTQHLGVLEGRI